MIEERLQVPAVWLLKDSTIAFADAGGPCTNGAEKYAPMPSFAAALALLAVLETNVPESKTPIARARIRCEIGEGRPELERYEFDISERLTSLTYF